MSSNSPGLNGSFEQKRIIYLLCSIAFGLPFLVGYGTLPLTNFTAEAICGAGMGGMLILVGGQKPADNGGKDLWSVFLALLLLLACTAFQYFSGGLHNMDAYAAVGCYLLAVIFAVWVGCVSGASAQALVWIHAAAATFAVSGALAAAASIAQYFGLDGQWIVLSPVSEAGRTFGFVRQPNHQGTFLSLALVSILYLHQLGRLRVWWLWPLAAVLIFGAVTTGSRTAILQVVFIAVGSALFYRKNRSRLYVAAGLIGFLALCWFFLFFLNQSGGSDFFGAHKLTQTSTEGLGVRRVVWLQTLAMIQDCSWLGCGALRFPAVYYLGGFAVEAGMVFSHSHNLFLQLAFDYGVAVAIIVICLILWPLWNARSKVFSPNGFYIFTVLGCIFIHSMVEFPLWYAYFLLPTGFFVGFILCGCNENGKKWLSPRLQGVSTRIRMPLVRVLMAMLLGGTMIGVTITMTRDFYRLTPLYVPGLQGTLPERIKEAEEVFWFRRFAEFPRLQVESAKHANYGEYANDSAYLGCVMAEPWFQTGTVLAMAQDGRIDEAKWLLFLYSTMTKGQMGPFKKALEDSKAPAAKLLLAYIDNIISVPLNAASFEKTCHAHVPHSLVKY